MNKTALLIAAIASAAAASLAAAPAEARQRPARCVVEGPETRYNGPCLFEAERDGSFTIDAPRGRSFSGGVSTVSLAITGRGVGEVRGLTSGGVNSRWGQAVRSPRQPACWVGSDFRVCAY